MSKGWVGVDLDGTLAEYHGWPADGSIGAPVPRMVRRVQAALAEGREVRVFTARVGPQSMTGTNLKAVDAELARQRNLIRDWTLEHVGQALVATATKDFACIEVWDDRARRVIANTGAFEEEVARAQAACRLVAAQVEAQRAQGFSEPWRTQLSAKLNDVEQELVSEQFASAGLCAAFRRRCGGGHAIILTVGIVKATNTDAVTGMVGKILSR